MGDRLKNENGNVPVMRIEDFEQGEQMRIEYKCGCIYDFELDDVRVSEGKALGWTSFCKKHYKLIKAENAKPKITFKE